MANIDYPELENRIVVYINADGYKGASLVVGCNFDIGLTLVDANDKDNYLFCMRGEMYPKKLTGRNDKRYKCVFYSLVSMLKKGCVDMRIILEVVNCFGKNNGGYPSSSNCSFSQ